VHRAALFGEGAEHTVLTRAFSGRLARGLSNRFTEATRAAGAPFAPYPLQSWLVSHLKAASVARGTSDFVSLWAGQAAPNLRFKSARALMGALEQEITA
jgi:nitronate monooxygenase